MPNTSVFRTFQPEDPNGLKRSSCMTLGSTSVRVIAAGLPEEEWGPPMRHVTNVYHMAPNTVILVGGSGGLLWSQNWPGRNADECVAQLATFARQAPASTPEALGELRKGFGGTMDLFIGEDFQILPKMHANFKVNPGIEIMVGRHEPCLADRHRFYSESLARSSEYGEVYAEAHEVAFAGGAGGGK